MIDNEGKNIFKKGVSLFNNEQFFEAHEVWESIWKCHKTEEWGALLQGLIQMAVAFHQIQQLKLKGAQKNLNKAYLNIQAYSEDCLGLDVKQIEANLFNLIAQVKNISCNSELNGTTFPKINLIEKKEKE